ncbi:MAG: cyclase family protein [Candidatus Kaiserbacteria bacterium]|nr:cyclase family protein [Candidatus Kaiserbacteria bacterium]
MRYVDLSHSFRDDMPVYPGDPQARLERIADIPAVGYTDHTISSGVHVGTHMDGPLHMIDGGKKLSEFPIETFFGRGMLVDARGKKEVTADLVPQTVAVGDIVLVLTGFGERYGSSEYLNDHPILAEEFAREIVRRGVKIVGLDFLSPDKSPFPVHKILLGADILIIENLTNLQELLNTAFEVIVLPIKIDADSAFCRAVARIA